LNTIQKTIPKTFKTHKYLLILLAVSAISLQTGYFIDEDSAWLISSVVYVIVPGALVAFSALLTIKMAKSGQSIKLILLFTLSVSMTFVAEQIWIVYELIGMDPFPSWADLFYLAAYPPLVLFLFKIIKIPIRTIPKSNLLFVGLLVSSFFIPTYWSTYDSAGEQSPLDLVLALLYPIADIIVLVPLLIGVLYSLDKRNYFLTYLLLGALTTLLADTFYLYLFQKDLYTVGSPVDILWIWGYIFYAFAIFPSSRFLDFIKKEPKKLQLRQNLMIPLLSGAVFLIAFITVLIITFFVNNEIESHHMENLIFYGIFIILLIATGITFFALKVKKIRHQFIVGLTFICIIFVIQTSFDHSIEGEIIGVSEYHDMMSIPAITTLDDIRINFEGIHTNMHGYVLDHGHALVEYDVGISQIRHLIDNYELLGTKTNEHGEQIADPAMQQIMLEYVETMRNSLEKYDSFTVDFISYDFPNDSQVESMFNGIDGEAETFRGILNDAKQMEIHGKIKAQNKISEYLQMGEFAHLLSIVFVILTIGAIIIVISNTLKNNLQILKYTTCQVAKGNFDARVVLKDKTEFSEIGNQINRMTDELAQYQEQTIKTEKLRSIGELASRLGHDLRNPLSAMKLSARIVRMKAAKNGDTQYEKNMQSIDKAIDRMSYQIESVLDFIRTKPLQIKEDSIYNIIKKTIDTLKVPQNIRINVEPIDVKANCDTHRISIVFTNLITNSIQAIGKNSGEITIRIKENQGKITCKVIDSGPGIPKDKITKVFEPLFTTKQTGTGLGLASCQSIMEQHSGTISVHNNPTTFTITLPKIITVQHQRGNI